MANLNLDEILALFENGERRYAEDPIFKSVADSLKMGLGVYAVLDHTLKDNKHLRSASLASTIRSDNERDELLKRISDLESKIEHLELGENL